MTTFNKARSESMKKAIGYSLAEYEGRDNRWFIGADYSVRVSKATADNLISFSLPKVGYERTVSSIKRGLFSSELMLQNISGMLVLSSCNCKVSDWPEYFGIEVKIRKARINNR